MDKMVLASGTCACESSTQLDRIVLAWFCLGFLVGLLLIAAWRYWMDKRSKSRIQKVSILEQCTWINNEDLSKIFGGSFPSHISFLTYEKVPWLNKILVKFWPFAVEATEQWAKTELQPMLETYTPAGISALTLDMFHLGKVPPQIEGVRIQSLHNGQVQMDMDFKWGGDGKIKLNVEPDWSSLPVPLISDVMPTELAIIKLSELSFYATIRVIFQLSDEIPCISAMVVTLLHEPKFKIGYTLSIMGGSIGDIPGIGDLITDMVNSFVADQVEWPHRVVLPVGDTPADVISDLGLKLQGKLRVAVVKAEGLMDENLMYGKSNRYVQLFVRVRFKKKTKKNSGTTHPEWNEEFEFDVEDTETQTLVLQVMTWSKVVHSEELGIAAVPLRDLKPDTECEITRKLGQTLDTDDDNRGQITVKLHYHPYTPDEQVAAMEAEKIELEAKLANGGRLMDAVGNLMGLSEEQTLTRTLSKHVGTGVTSFAKVLGAGVETAVRSPIISSGVRRISTSLQKRKNTASTSNNTSANNRRRSL